MERMPSKYNPLDIEKKWQDRWKNANCFKPKIDDSPAYSILMPPPNVTGTLTLGHVLNCTIQDIFARKASQEGYDVLWLMGTDHAGIATQTVVEKAIYKQQKKRRDEIGKDGLIKEITEWIAEKGNIILHQIQKLGLSLDLSDQCFTMDSNYSLLVQETFVRLYDKGLIYKGKKMVSWCPISLTALSDEEVCYKKQNGHIFYFKMQLVEQPYIWLTIATTRPETIMGDVAIAVNPADDRYKDWIGYHVRAVFPNQIIQQLPIIGDDMVDPNFGTGILKITPAHDLMDYEIGQKHHLPCVDILNPNGTLNQLAGELEGMDRFVARKYIVELLKQQNAYVKEEIHENSIGFSERGDVPIEYRLSEQWFLKYPKVQEARAAVKEGKIKFFPQYFEKVYDHWMESIHDWCISRQIWWGHRIPAWKNHANEIRVQIDSPGVGWEQEMDVLDTWFSSWLWIYGRLKVTGNEKLIKKFSPISLLVTGPDIIFFWVARMVMANFEYTNDIPFSQVYFTGIIRDKQGRKMSKSLGNSPDPIQLIEKYGADALRLGLIRSVVDGKDIQFDEKQIELGRNLITKLWNATRFRLLYNPLNPKIEQDNKKYPDLIIWLFDRFDKMLGKIETAYIGFHLQEVIHSIHHFFWYDYCDKFLESVKPLLSSDDPKISSIRSLLLKAMDDIFAKILILFHPFIPHVTEELWEILEYSVNDEKLVNKFLFNQHFPPSRYFSRNDPLAISDKK